MRASIPRWILPLLLLLGATPALGVHYPRLYVVDIYGCDAGTCFSPSPLTIVASDFVIFANAPQCDPEGYCLPAAPGLHNVVADDGSFRCAIGCDGEGGDGTPTESFWYFTREFQTPGVVRYHDEVSGASGAITVLSSDPTSVAVEYYFADWNFYFLTAFPDEIAALDAGAFGGAWKRTGQSFSVWTDLGSGAVPTCRFFSGTTFAPRSTHFYTQYPDECLSLTEYPQWLDEGIAFYLGLPDASGSCGAGTRPLYRAYNNGMGGAPNHRYTTSPAILDQMLAAGWVFEGNGVTRAFACIPE